MDYAHKLRASLAFSKDYQYFLGSDMAFDVILDDPNGNVSLAPSEYKAALGGYYLFSYKASPLSLVPTGSPPLGNLISNLQVYVNGQLARESFSPWLSSKVSDKNMLSSLISLKAGDVVSMKLKLYSLDQSGALMDVPGIVMLEGGNLENEKSLFKIALVSENWEYPA